MAVFPFTVRAIDSENAFSDRQFSINVRNTRVERYLIIDSTNAWTSNDLVNWTIRLGQGGTHCAYGNGMWMVIAGTGIRTSADGINWTFTPTANLVVTRPNGDAATWVSPTSAFDSGTSTSLNFAGGRFWFSRTETNVGHELFSSADGINWRRQIVLPPSGSWNLTSQFIQYSKRSVVDVGGGTLLYNSNTTISSVPALSVIGYISTDNGVTWAGLRRNDLATTASQCSSYLTRFNGVYYAFSTQPQNPGGNPYAGTSMTYSYSTDGSNWINSTLNTGNAGSLADFNRHPTSVCYYVNGQLVVLGGRTGANTSGIGHLQTRSVNGTGWEIDLNRIKNLNSAALNSAGSNPSWQYRNGVLLGTINVITGTDTTQTTTVSGPGVRYSVDGGLTWAASFPLTSTGTTNLTGYTDAAIMG